MDTFSVTMEIRW